MNAAALAATVAPRSPHGLAAGWSAELDLGFEVVAGKSALVRNRHRGPLAVQRAFYPESNDLAHVYLLHPPGGIVAGDQLTVRVHVAPGARALVTTPAATKFYRSEGRVAEQTQLLRVSEGASLEWLPQETIVFGSAQVSTKTRVELEPGGTLLRLGHGLSGPRRFGGSLRQWTPSASVRDLASRPPAVDRALPIRRERASATGRLGFGGASRLRHLRVHGSEFGGRCRRACGG